MEQATLQEEFLRYLGIHKVHILAHDLGDTVALEMLARYFLTFFKLLQVVKASYFLSLQCKFLFYMLQI